MSWVTKEGVERESPALPAPPPDRWKEVATVIGAYLSRAGWSHAEIGRLFNRSGSWVSKLTRPD